MSPYLQVEGAGSRRVPGALTVLALTCDNPQPHQWGMGENAVGWSCEKNSRDRRPAIESVTC